VYNPLNAHQQHQPLLAATSTVVGQPTPSVTRKAQVGVPTISGFFCNGPRILLGKMRFYLPIKLGGDCKDYSATCSWHRDDLELTTPFCALVMREADPLLRPSVG
jgi:hypothetical protein